MEKLTLFFNRIIAGTGFGIGMGSAFALVKEYDNIDNSKDIEELREAFLTAVEEVRGT